MPEQRREDDETLKALVPLIKDMHSDIKEFRKWQVTVTRWMGEQETRVDTLSRDLAHLDKNVKHITNGWVEHMSEQGKLEKQVSHHSDRLKIIEDDVDSLKGSRDRQRGMYKHQSDSRVNWSLWATIGATVVAFLALVKSYIGK